LLKDMKQQIEKEADADEEAYEKQACWCETNDKAKTKAIADAEARLSDLGTTVEKMTALSSTLVVEIKGLEKEVAKNKQSLEVATALRERQHADFIAEEKEMLQSIRALQAAVTVLAKHHGAAFLESHALAEAAAAAQAQLLRHRMLLQGAVSPHQRRVLAALAQPSYYDASPSFKRQYEPRSGEIFGILREMKATFEADLSASQREELEAEQAHEALRAAKLNEISTGESSLHDKQQQRASAEERLAQSKQEREDTEASLGADKTFLLELRQRCSMTDSEWEQRQRTRQAELAAVSEAIALLSSDDARDLFGQVLRPSLLQAVPGARAKAAAALGAVVRGADAPRLAALAVAVRLDPFPRVKKAIDDMVADLLREKQLEVQHRDWCTAELSKNELTTERKVHAKAALESKAHGLELTVAGLNSTIRGLRAEIAELERQRQRAAEDRALQQKEFEATVADQRQAQVLLQQALDVLRRVYAPQALLQARGASVQPATPPALAPYERHGSGAGVLAMLERILQQAKRMEAEALEAETQARDALTQFVQQTTESVAAKEASIVDRGTEMSQASEDLLEAKSELSGTVSELEGLSVDLAALHGSCDFVLKNFELRQAARDEEVAALRQAKAYLSGMRA